VDGRAGTAAVERGFDLAVRGPQPAPDAVLRTIALFKFVKAGFAALISLGALRLLHSEMADRLRAWTIPLASASDPGFIHDLAVRLGRFDPGQVRILRIGALAAALLFVVEGVGLWRARRWAQYLTVVATLSFVPVEIYGLTRRVGVPALTALIFNLAVVAYLIFRLGSKRRQE
jgi:uncharacterized membrane protein (DUF2068 family)